MNQDEFNTARDQYLSQLREIETQLQHQGNSSMQYTTDDIKNLIKTGKIPEDLGTWYLEFIDEQNRHFSAWQDFCKKNPNMPAEEQMIMFHGAGKTLSFESIIKQFESMVNLGKIHNMLSTNLESINIDQLETNKLPEQFFKTIAHDEFFISRLFADPLNNIYKHSLFESFCEPELINTGLYVTQAECINSLGDTIRVEYRYRASNYEEAKKQRSEFLIRLRGRQQKIIEACWSLVSKKQNRLVTCYLTDLMLEAYPGREKSSFSTDQKLEFFQDLLDLSQTQIVVTKKTVRNRTKINSFLLPFLTIHKTSTYNMANPKKSERYPNELSFSVLHNAMYERETLYSVGAGFKNKTLELHEEDRNLSAYIQIRKNQMPDKQYITFTDATELIKISNLDGIKHSGMANKKLINKFKRLKSKGIIVSYPDKISYPFKVKIR